MNFDTLIKDYTITKNQCSNCKHFTYIKDDTDSCIGICNLHDRLTADNGYCIVRSLLDGDE